MKKVYILTEMNGDILGVFAHNYKKQTLVNVIGNHYGETGLTLDGYKRGASIFIVGISDMEIEMYLTESQLHS